MTESTEHSSLILQEASHEETRPVLPKWFDAFKFANHKYPQDNIGIFLLPGEAIMQSLLAKDVSWLDVVQSRLNEQQLQEMKQAVHSAHRNFGVDKFPKEYLKEGEEAFAMADTAMDHLWDTIVRNGIASTILVYAGAWDPENNPEQKRIVESGTPWMASDADNLLIHKFLTDEANKEQVVQLAELYKTGASVLRSPEATKLADRRNAEMNARRKTPPRQRYQKPLLSGMRVPYIGMIRGMVTDHVEKRAEELFIPPQKAAQFVEGYMPR